MNTTCNNMTKGMTRDTKIGFSFISDINIKMPIGNKMNKDILSYYVPLLYKENFYCSNVEEGNTLMSTTCL